MESEEKKARRQELLVALPNAVAARPFDVSRIKAAREEILAELGEGALVEACAAIASMEVSTRAVLTTGKTPLHPIKLAILSAILSVGSCPSFLAARSFE